MGIIYKCINTINNKEYIGLSTVTLEKRKLNHKSIYKNSKTHFHRSLVKYKWDNFKWEILETCIGESLKFLQEREEYWIKYFDTYNNGLNMTLGGNCVYTLTNEIKNNMSIAQKKRFSNPIELEKHIKNIKLSHSRPETKLKMSLSQKKRFKEQGVSQETKNKLSKIQKERMKNKNIRKIAIKNLKYQKGTNNG